MIRHLLTAVDAGGFGLRDDGLKVTVIDVANFLLSPVSSFPSLSWSIPNQFNHGFHGSDLD